jgi:bifunctional non-homologous end joining protein LigD
MPRPSSPFVEPLELSEQEKPPSGDAWVHEIKWDGYRVQAHLQDGKATIYTRRGNDWTRQFRPIADAVAKLPAKRAIIDGEAVVLGESGIADFHELRRELDGRSRRLRLQAFDLLALDGADLRPLPLLERKDRLKRLLAGAPPALVYVEHLNGDSARILGQACRMGIEGIVSKRADSPYRSGRSTAWVKTKCERSDTFVVVGFEIDKDRPRHLSGLHLAWRRAGKLAYAGSVELGIDDATALELRKALDPLASSRSPLPAPVKGVRPTWVQPELLVEVAFPNASMVGRLRHPKFKGVRDDLQGGEAPLRKR